ncbi:G-alpha-domain-containing protein [Phellopilus nigrolimitatus]|nr:G-alpha-domain-containing protein [Phellopilus nigrolimitatus]
MAVATPYNDLQPVRRIDEAEAARISNRIDEELKAEREAIRRRKSQKRDVKVMLLGQAESGKSTLQKQFQLYYASQTLEKERPAWRPVVHFNIIKAVRMILEELDFEFTQSPAQAQAQAQTQQAQAPVRPPLPQPPQQRTQPMSSTARGKLPALPGPPLAPNGPRAAGTPASAFIVANGSNSASGSASASGSGTGGGWQEDLAQLRTKLLPLVAVEDALARDLSGGVTVTGAGGRAGVFVRSGWQALVAPVASRAWAGAFGGGGGGGNSGNNANGSNGNAHAGGGPVVNDLVARMLAATKDEVAALWRHPSVRTLVKYRKLRLDESAAFFLENVYRIAEPDYLPATEDLLNVRLQTLGVKEHSFDISLSGTHVNWLLYDVGGARGQRHAWVPYFDDATAIIFLAPISAFDQYLEEDPRTNRIDDSLQLFTAICSNKLLKNTHLVLLLNKTDLLRQKLAAGIKVRKYITSYGDRPNNYEDVSEYFRAHFLQVHRRNDISKRALYAHFTSMLDIKATQKIIVNVGEAIIRSYITDAGLT